MEMSDAAKQAKREYQAAWRKKNPDKVRRYQAEYWERHAAMTNVERAKMLHGQGRSLRQIAEEIGVSHMKVSRMLQRRNMSVTVNVTPVTAG